MFTLGINSLLTALCFLIFTALSTTATAIEKNQASSGQLTVTTLGTGMPYPSAYRFGPSTLVQAGSTNLLFDAGRGAMTRLWQMGLVRDDLNAVFLTHLHSDHTVGLPDLYLTGWVLDAAMNQGPAPFVVYGPGPVKERQRIGTHESMKFLKDSYQADINIRSKLPADDIAIDAHDIDPHGGIIYDRSGVKVTAFPVDHGEADPAFGYRVDYDGRSVVISGDTRYYDGEPLLNVAKGANVIIHEVMAAPKAYLQTPKGAGIMSIHTTPEQAGKVFSQTKPGLAVYYHVVLLPADGPDRLTMDDVIRETRTTYGGPLLVADDLTSISIEKNGQINVVKPIFGLLPIAPGKKTGRHGWEPY